MLHYHAYTQTSDSAPDGLLGEEEEEEEYDGQERLEMSNFPKSLKSFKISFSSQNCSSATSSQIQEQGQVR